MKMQLARLSTAAIVACGVLYAPSVEATPFEDLLKASQAEMAKVNGRFRVAFDWTDSDAKPVFAELVKQFPFIKAEYKRETGVAPFQRYMIEIQQGKYPPYELFDVASEFEKQYWDAGFFVKPPFDYKALNDSMPSDWPKIYPAAMAADGRYLATVAQMRGNAWNVKMVAPGKEPKTWAACLDPALKGKVVIDGRNKTQALAFDPKTSADTTAWLAGLRKNDVVITNGQAQVLERIVSGEFPVTCAINYHTTQRLIDGGEKTLGFALADTVPVELATRLGVPKWSETPATDQLVTLWLATKGQPAIDKAAYRGFPWIPGSSLFEQSKGKYFAVCSVDCFNKYEDLNKQYADLLGIPYVP
jgi:ABC-type Fe3+ transport system substrate-binding protein